MSQKEKIIKQNSPKVNSEYLTTISSSNYQINQTLLSSNSKENIIRANAPQLKCTCNHPMPKTFQKQQLKCTCKVYKNNNINNMNSYKTESRQSRFDQMTSPIKYNTINNYMGMSGQKVSEVKVIEWILYLVVVIIQDLFALANIKEIVILIL